MSPVRASADFAASYVPFADAEISRASQDKLSRVEFARGVARLISGIPRGADSTVIGLIGPWGGGKTSILNLVREELEVAGKFAVASFTPWAVSDSNSLMVEFFATLLDSHESLGNAKRRQTFVGLARKVTPVVGSLGVGGKAAEKTFEAFMGDGSWEKQFKKLDKVIAESGAQILITVDDVDRLHGEEILTLIKTIRMLGRFHNVHYLLAYDHSALVDALKPSLGGNERRAGEYLEKIVQYPLDIPPAQEVQLRALLEAGLEDLFTSDESAIFSDARGRFQLLYQSELKRYLTTIRSVKRFIAQAHYYFGLVRGHVDVGDFLILTFLRLHFPVVYNALPRWRAELTGLTSASEQNADQPDREAWSQRFTALGIDSEDDRECVLSVLKRIFPEALGGSSAEDPVGRVANKNYFDRFFVFGLPEGDVSDEQVRQDFLAVAVEGAQDDYLYRKTFRSPSVEIRRLAVEKAEPLVNKADPSNVPVLADFIVWLMSREDAADPRYMFGSLLGDLLVGHPGFETTNACVSFVRKSSGVRFLRSALDRAHAMRHDFLGFDENAGPEAAVWIQLREAIATVGAAELTHLAKDGPNSARDFLETYAVVNSHGDMALMRKQLTKALLAKEFVLEEFSAFFVYSDLNSRDGEYRLLDLDIDRVLTLIEPEVVLTTELAPCPEDAAIADRSLVSWEQRRVLALHGLWKWQAKTTSI